MSQAARPPSRSGVSDGDSVRMHIDDAVSGGRDDVWFLADRVDKEVVLAKP